MLDAHCDTARRYTGRLSLLQLPDVATVAARARDVGRGACAGLVCGGQKLRGSAAALWRQRSGEQRHDCLRLLLGGVLPVAVLSTMGLTLAVLWYVEGRSAAQLASCRRLRDFRSSSFYGFPADPGTLS